MIAHKYITKIIAVIMALAVCLCLCAEVFSDELKEVMGGSGVSMSYEKELFDTDEIISVNIIMDADQWEDMLANAASETYYECDVEINGKMYYQVAIRPKGNTSLSSIVNDPTTDRYSFKLEFDHYVEGQTCYGLDKLILNNNYADATNMKEALVYDMFRYMGADASLYNYAKISVNGDYWGVYLALEAVEDSFMLRNYGTQNGALYKPEGVGGGGGDMPDGDNMPGDGEVPGGGNMPGDGEMPENGMPDNRQNGDGSNISDNENTNIDDAAQETDSTNTEELSHTTDDIDNESSTDINNTEIKQTETTDNNNNPGGNMQGGMGGSGGADLNYSDDDLDSYSTIWDGEITDTSKSDHKRVVKALKNISEGTDLEDFMDIDNLLKYMAVHVFSVNEDSLSGSMAHNYYLYEYKGQLNLIPWDYNLAWGGMGGMGNAGNTDQATSVVNDAIDDSFSATNFFDTLMADETYHAQYYTYMRQLVEEYVNGGAFEAFYNRVRSQIDELVETDPNAFYTYDAYVTAAETLYQVIMLRAESISGQLDGTILSTSEAQRNSDALIDASSLDISVMGSMNSGDDGMQGGGPGGDFNGEMPQGGPNGDFNGEMPDGVPNGDFNGEMPQGGPNGDFNGEMPDGVPNGDFNGEMPANDSNGNTNGEMSDDASNEDSDEKISETTQNDNFNGERPQGGPNGAPGDFDPSQMDGNSKN